SSCLLLPAFYRQNRNFGLTTADNSFFTQIEKVKSSMTVRNVDGRIDTTMFQEPASFIKEAPPEDLRSSTADLQLPTLNLRQNSFALPLPRIPTPTGMVDLSKLPSVLAAALLNGLKNFGSLGLGFARSVAGALGSAFQAVESAENKFADVLNSDLKSIKSETS